MPAVALTVETAMLWEGRATSMQLAGFVAGGGGGWKARRPAAARAWDIEARAVEQLALADRSASRPRSAAAAAPKQGGRALWKKRDFVRRVNLSGID